MKSSQFFVLIAALLLIRQATAADAQARSARETETVALIKRCLPAVVAIRAYWPGEKPEITNVDHGGGSVIHPNGFILTNHHVVKRATRIGVILADKRELQARVVARYPTEDLALLKVDADKPFATLPLGHSDDLMLGEPVVVIGAPAGLEHTVSTGIISGLGRASVTQDSVLPWLVQTDAAVSGGSSGGPLINALGEQIGIVTSKNRDAENINFAIAIDRVWTLFPKMVSAEQRNGFTLGCEVEQSPAKIKRIAEESPAELAGLQVGDVICKLNDVEIRHVIDMQLALLERKPGDTLAVEAVRGDRPVNVSVTLAEIPLPEPVADTGMTAGLKLSLYQGTFEKLPDFAQLKPHVEHPIPRIALDTVQGSKDDFALRFAGFIKAPADGLYTFLAKSDDGSRVTVAGQLVVDNDGMHAPFEASGIIRLKAGLHPIIVDYFERNGNESLRLSWEGPELPKQEVPATAFFIPSEGAH